MELEFLQEQLDRIAQEHKDLDLEIASLAQNEISDDLHIHRLKKKKLSLKDQIKILESRLMPNIIA
jgi:hypothetical protein